MFDAVADVILQQLIFNFAKRGLNGGDLGHDVDAVSILIHHAPKSSNLAFDAAEPLQALVLRLLLHGPFIPPGGILGNLAGYDGAIPRAPERTKSLPPPFGKSG